MHGDGAGGQEERGGDDEQAGRCPSVHRALRVGGSATTRVPTVRLQVESVAVRQ
jgi:hypothetical protein